MDPVTLCSTVLAIAFIGFIIYYANQHAADVEMPTALRWMLYLVIATNFMLGLFTLQAAWVNNDPMFTEALAEAGASFTISLTDGIMSFVLALVCSGMALLFVRMQPARAGLKRLLPAAGYNPAASVHTVAIVLTLFIIVANFITFVLAGGIAGMASDLATDGLEVGAVLFQQVLWIVVSLLGVGFAIRRDLPDTLSRLGLRLPTPGDMISGVIMAIIGLVLVFVISTVWALLVPPEEIAAQTAASDQIAQAFDSLPLAFIIALAVAVGEEVFFRGALQPVFGNLLTSVFFAIVHTQYALTPATLAIFVVSLGFGWLRQRFSTSSAIIAHFFFNFIQLALALLASNLLGGF
ncbi:MAG: CPBP family intramembrane glutamic endopeptidase [Chloroflexota bacterium]|nr:CPBP family intramembrane glutamic endopeptidase [Chloroflexota bacterium]